MADRARELLSPLGIATCAELTLNYRRIYREHEIIKNPKLHGRQKHVREYVRLMIDPRIP